MTEVFKLGVIVSAQDLLSSKIQQISDKWNELKKTFAGNSEIETAMNRVSQSLDKIKQGSALAAAGFFVLKSLPVDDARKFEKELAMLQATSNATATEMVNLREAAIQAGIKTQFSPDQAVQGLTALASSGMNAAQSMKALLPVLDLASASAGKLSIDNAAADVAATVNTFKRGAGEVADTFTTMANISSFSIQDLGSAWRGVNAIASGMNQSMEETALMLSAVKRAGFTTAESGEKVRMALEALSTPSKNAQKELEKLGVKAYDQTGKFKSAIVIMDELRNAFDKKGLSEEKQNNALSKILLSGGSQAYRALMSLSADERKDWLDKLKDKEGATKKFAKTQLQTYEGISVTLEGVLSTFKVVFGEALLPILKTLKQTLIDVLTPMLEFFKEHPGLVSTIMKFAFYGSAISMLVGGFKMLMGVKSLFIAVTALSTNAQFMEAAANTTLGNTINLLSFAHAKNILATKLSVFWTGVQTAYLNGGILAAGRFGLAQMALGAKTAFLTAITKIVTAAQWLWNAAMMANPIGLIIGLVVLLGGAIYGIVKYFQSIPSAVEKSHDVQMKAMEGEKSALEKNLEKLYKQEQTLQSLGLTGDKAYTEVQRKIDQTKKKIEDMNDALATSNGVLANLIKARADMESQLQNKAMVLDIAKSSGDKNAVKKLQAEYDALKVTIQNTNAEIQKQKDLPGDLQSLVQELDKLQTAKKTIDTDMPGLKNSKKYKEIEEQIKKAEESLETMEVRLSQTAQVSGSKFVETFAQGMDKEFITLYKKVSKNNSFLMRLFPQSDAKEGPFSRISESGKSFLKTWGEGFDSGKGGLFTSISSTLDKAKGYLDMSSLTEGISMESPVSLEKVLKSGEAIVKTLATGVKNSASTLYEAIKSVFQKSWKLFTQSDAKEGPFSKVTYSGKALINTFAEGSEHESPKLHSSLERTFGESEDVLTKTYSDTSRIQRSEPTTTQTNSVNNTQKSNVLQFEYFIKEFNISGSSSEENLGFGQLFEKAIYEELKRKEALL